MGRSRALITGITGMVGSHLAEYLLEHGIIDMVVTRTEMKATLARVIGLLRVKELPAAA